MAKKAIVKKTGIIKPQKNYKSKNVELYQIFNLILKISASLISVVKLFALIL